MAGVSWPLTNERPIIEVVLTVANTGQPVTRRLLADTGAGSRRDSFELILDEDDCLFYGGIPSHTVSLGGAYDGFFPCYNIQVEIPVLSFSDTVDVVGVAGSLAGLDGIACFRFLNRFTYGNFGDGSRFGLET